MKKFLAVIVCCTLIAPIGATSALAETGPGALSLYTGSDFSETAKLSETGDTAGDIGTDDPGMSDAPEYDTQPDDNQAETSVTDPAEETPAADAEPEGDGTAQTPEDTDPTAAEDPYDSSAETGGTSAEEPGDGGSGEEGESAPLDPLTALPESADGETGEEEDGEAEDEEEEGEEEEEEEEEEEDEEEEDEEADEAAAGIVLYAASVKDYVRDLIDLGSLFLQYDDRYDLSILDGISSGEAYTILMDTETAHITSYQVENGDISSEMDESLLVQETTGSTAVVASGVGSADFYIIRTEDLEKLEEIANENPDTDDPDSVEPTAAVYNAEASDILTGEPAESASDVPVEETAEDSTAAEGNTDSVSADIAELAVEAPDDGSSDIVVLDADDIPDEDKVYVYMLSVTVEAAPLTLMFLTGQSNMEGSCSDSTGYERGASIACTEGEVYSTYMPSTATRGKNITGISSISAGTASSAGNYVAGSLQGTVASAGMTEDSAYVISGTLEQPTNMTGGSLTYPLNSLTSAGGGKTGPDSGLAWEWNQLTGDKVWVINTAYGSTDISDWTSGGKCYELTSAVWAKVLSTYNAEISAGHYKTGSVSGGKLVFWLQGETDDAKNLSSATDYENSFDNVYSWMGSSLGNSSVPFGIIMVRAGYAKNSPTTEKDLYMTVPRIAQYFLGSSNSSYKNVYVVSNANEQWVTDSGVASYFKSSSSSGLNYPTQGTSKSLPTKVSEVHGDIHYSQVGHNENGITAAYGMWEALNSSGSCTVTWKDADGNALSTVEFEYSDESTKVFPIAEPVYFSKKVSYSVGDSISYVFSTGVLAAASDQSYGKSKITPSGGSGTLTVNIETPIDFTAIAGKNYTGLYKYNGTWWYLVKSIFQRDCTSVVKNENGWWYVNNGKVDKTYTGFATNENGSWYMENGKLLRDQNTVIKDTNGALGDKNEWYYVVGSKVQTDYTGVANYKNSSGWWYVTKGRVDRTYTGVAKNQNGWWYVKDGKVDKTYTGFATNSNGSWYMENGKLLRDQNTVIKDTNGALGSKSEWYYVVGSKVQTDYTGVANYKNSSGWWYVTNGRVDRSYTGVAKNKNGWWYVKDGKVDKTYTGFATNANGSWYMENGKLLRDKNTVIKDTNGALGSKSEWYYVVGSKVQSDFTGLANHSNDSGWWYIKNGKVDRTFTGIATNKNGTYYIKEGKVQKSFTGTVTINGKKYSVTRGKVA